jgi:hypothetical protein
VRKQALLIVAVALALAASTASASLVAVGDPIQGSSWGQEFEWIPEAGNVSFSALAVYMSYTTSGGPVYLSNEPLEPVLGGFAIPGQPTNNWALLGTTNNGATLPTGNLTGITSLPTAALAQGSSTTELDFIVWFSGVAATESFDFTAEIGYIYSQGFATEVAAGLVWNPSTETWTVTEYTTAEEIEALNASNGNPSGVGTVPEPAAITIWGGLAVAGLGGAGFVTFRRRK